MKRSIKRLALALGGGTALIASAAGAGIDSRTLNCGDLQRLVAAQGFVFLSQPAFGDFVVAGPYYCGGGQVLQLRSVPNDR